MNQSDSNVVNTMPETILAGSTNDEVKLIDIFDPEKVVIEVKTVHSTYQFVLIPPVEEVSTAIVVRGGEYFPRPRVGWFKGSSVSGSSLLKFGRIVGGFCLEFGTTEYPDFVTSEVRVCTVRPNPGMAARFRRRAQKAQELLTGQMESEAE